MKKTIAILLCMLLFTGLIAGCGGNGAGSGDSASADAKTLTFGCQMYSDGMICPWQQTNCAWNCMRYGISECLFKFDDNSQPQPWLAESIENTDDHKTWTIKLKEGVKFSNGEDMTASKVKAALDYVREKGPEGSSTPENFLEFAAEVTADDANNTIVIQTETPYANLAGNLADPAMAIVDYEGTGDNYENGMIGTGPYMVKEFHNQVGYDMVKNPYYREEVPYDNVTILFMGDASAKANALLAGQIDIAENIMSVSDLQKLQDDPNFTVDITAGVRCGFSWINFNGILANDDLRHAVLMAIDSDTICHSNTIGDLYTPGFSVLPSGMGYGYETLNNPWAYDADAAAKLLDDAGIVDTNGNGIRELDGQDIYLNYVSYENRLLNDFSDAHTQYLTKIGIGVNSDYGSSDDQWNKLVAGEYDLNNNNWNHLIAGAPDTYLGNWCSNNSANYCGYKNEEYDKLYDELIHELDTDARHDKLVQMQQILIDDGVAVIDGYYNSCMVYNNSTVGYAHILPNDYYWISQEITPAN
ncbi:MAG: ABC transporter substrate-binding protein [Firmicutes bacterium]|nr:ABC transporter substrate-binding protein [Bacillota bacterium]